MWSPPPWRDRPRAASLRGDGRKGPGQRFRDVAAQLQRLALGHAAQVAPAAHGAGDEMRRRVVGHRAEGAEAEIDVRMTDGFQPVSVS